MVTQQRNFITKRIHGDVETYVGEEGEIFYDANNGFANLRVSDGTTAGGVEFDIPSIKHNGFADYNDATTAVTPITLVADTWTTLTNDGAGAFSRESLPEGVTTLRTGTGQIDISELTQFSDILIRTDFTVTPSSNNSALFFRYTLGTGLGEYTLEKSLGRLDLGAGIEYRQSLTTDYIYAGDSNTIDNPITLQIKLTGGGTVVNAGMAIKVYKR